MQRREFIVLLCGGVVCAHAAYAQQQTERMRRIGVLMPYPPTNKEWQGRVRAFREELRKLGWTLGINVQFDERWTGDNMDLIRSAANNLVELNPEVIVAIGGRVIPVLMELTRSIPIVIPGGTDPVGRGYAESLARPGSNVTGFSTMELSVIGKMLQTLKEIAPRVSSVFMIYNPDNPYGSIFSSSFEAAAKALDVEPTIVQIRGLADIERVVASAAAKRDSAIFVPLDLTVGAYTEETVGAMARHRLPAVYSDRSFVASGGLVFYGTDRTDLFRRSASYVHRILRGEKVSDLPYQQPTKYELVINLRTAKALGLTVPPNLLLTADEVIE